MKIWDISVSVSPRLATWPGDPPIVLKRYRTIAQGSVSNDSLLSCSVHTGTHVDAPLEYIERGKSVEQLPLDVLIGPVFVAEFPHTNAITPDHLEDLRLPDGTTRVLFKTRNSALWADSDREFYPDFVALTTDAARWVVEKGIRLVGIDYLSVQLFHDRHPLTHRVLIDGEVVIVEGLNLQDVSVGAYQFVCLPLKLVGSDGAPARAVLLEDG